MNDATTPERSGFSLDRLSTLVQTLAILGAGAWGVYTFIYEARIKPGLAPPSVSVTTTLEKAGERDGRLAIRSTVTRTNVGETGVRILGLTYNVIGTGMRFAGPDAEPGPESLAGTSQVTAARYGRPERQEMVLRQGILFEGATALPAEPSALQPGESVSRDLIFYVERDRYDSLRFQVDLAYAKLSEPPVPLILSLGPEGRIEAVPGPGCAEAAERCKALTTTDFGTEFSLW
ncbi:hypothetical protein [Belnapia rosea]|uniref:Uncharacterized protein n=1 Tax=Belnapia rosea TaxID=938405 RepID=A0A1G6RQT5_9PROT|nr:hypothetical protein [Belnapia rosea]SDD06898.1 hypothetical protein SAMN04487779_1004100 [Belnapia rosea]